ncbi:MAG: DNA-processing protein DprA [Vicinamibacterales bacterium]
MQNLSLGSPGFPSLLSQIHNPPHTLWVRGDSAVLDRPAVAIVGSRAASSDGLAIAGDIAADLARAGIVVVSGMARGIDSAAHAGALDANGVTVAVMGTGVDRVYPPEHRDLASRIATCGALISELPPGTPPRAFHFPLRNRIISGLSRAVVVIEAPEASGALITAREALDQGREVMVVPGRVVGGRNRGGHALLKDGAKLVEAAVDILQELGMAVLRRPAPLPQHLEFSVDDVAREMKLAPGEALARLLEWELTGEIRRIGSGRFVRTKDRVLT